VQSTTASNLGSHHHTRATNVASVSIRSAQPQQRRTPEYGTMMNDNAKTQLIKALPPIAGYVPDASLRCATV
jgi:hypothetical protein|tara:strand:+ start:3741 stop:3956 length:216 start_codon:yes stop_codon:yes gene_type:complete